MKKTFLKMGCLVLVLLMLVSAFYNRDAMIKAYETAVKEKYRFFSFGDAMIIK